MKIIQINSFEPILWNSWRNNSTIFSELSFSEYPCPFGLLTHIHIM